MDSRPRFTGDEAYYQMEDEFLEELEMLPPLYGAAIIMQLDRLALDMYNENKLRKPSKKLGMVAGVVPLEDALFFKVEYLNSKSMHPLFYKFKIITSDDYLDYLNLNKAIKHEKE